MTLINKIVYAMSAADRHHMELFGASFHNLFCY